MSNDRKIVSPKTMHTMPLSLLHSLLKQPTPCLPELIHHQPEYPFHRFPANPREHSRAGRRPDHLRSSGHVPVGTWPEDRRQGERARHDSPSGTRRVVSEMDTAHRTGDGLIVPARTCACDPRHPLVAASSQLASPISSLPTALPGRSMSLLEGRLVEHTRVREPRLFWQGAGRGLAEAPPTAGWK